MPMVFTTGGYRDSNVNLRTQLLRIMQRAGVQQWPKLFQNLRSSRETELTQRFPMHVVCAWIGNREPVAAKHYLQVTGKHFEEAVQNPVQRPSELTRKPWHENTNTPRFTEEYQGVPECTSAQVAAVGVEPTTRGL